jgi:hypothetical protein
MNILFLDSNHVYVVLEIPEDDSGIPPEIHGVFAKREHAEEKKAKLISRHRRKGYIAVLKQRIKGA